MCFPGGDSERAIAVTVEWAWAKLGILLSHWHKSGQTHCDTVTVKSQTEPTRFSCNCERSEVFLQTFVLVCKCFLYSLHSILYEYSLPVSQV